MNDFHHVFHPLKSKKVFLRAFVRHLSSTSVCVVACCKIFKYELFLVVLIMIFLKLKAIFFLFFFFPLKFGF